MILPLILQNYDGDTVIFLVIMQSMERGHRIMAHIIHPKATLTMIPMMNPKGILIPLKTPKTSLKILLTAKEQLMGPSKFPKASLRILLTAKGQLVGPSRFL